MNTIDVLKQRGFFKQCSDEEKLANLLNNKRISAYCGFDPTSDSLQIGNLIPIMVLSHLQRCRHKPIVLIGSGTTMIGDPSGKTEMRKMITKETIDFNAAHFKKQMNRFIDFSDDKAIMVNNADWLMDINYISFLRDIGVHFSVNRMIAAEAYKIRMETGLSFIEFNYQILQAFDFYHLNKTHNCVLQVGGDDQWGNILAGVELTRRKSNKEVYALTFPLITTSDGKKMGKTEKGAVWLAKEKTPIYDYYQFWVNVTDKDVVRFLKMFTYMELNEIARYEKIQGEELRDIKHILAFETTKILHGEEEAKKAQASAKAIFSKKGSDFTLIPTTELDLSNLETGIPVIDFFHSCGLCASRSDARRLIQQGGGYINESRIENIETQISKSNLTDNGIFLRAGKKKVHRIIISE